MFNIQLKTVKKVALMFIQQSANTVSRHMMSCRHGRRTLNAASRKESVLHIFNAVNIGAVRKTLTRSRYWQFFAIDCDNIADYLGKLKSISWQLILLIIPIFSCASAVLYSLAVHITKDHLENELLS